MADPPSVHPQRDGHVYNSIVDRIQEQEYPSLIGTTYLDHAGTTPYAKSAIENWTAELTANLFGNPHSASAASQLSSRRIDDIRLKVLKFFNASPDDFDIVFVANATAAIKLVFEAFRDNGNGFWYGFHADAHTSLVGGRELAGKGSMCFQHDQSLEAWIATMKDQTTSLNTLQLIAYPAQSNMTGRRLSMQYCEQIRKNAAGSGRKVYTLLDVASLVSTSPLDLGDASTAPDFVALSFYKIFGFPDLGALIVRKNSADVLMQKRYFAGGTVDGVTLSDGGWHMKKTTLHDALEEGTLPFHNILALDHAMNSHAQIFGSMEQVSRHSKYLAAKARSFLTTSRHANGKPICEVYGPSETASHGPIVAFNLRGSSGKIISASEVEKLCIIKGIQLRTGGLCNPGGIAHHLNISSDQVKSNYTAGRRCNGSSELIDGKPTGAIRISFGAMSTRADLHHFISFIEEYYIERNILGGISDRSCGDVSNSSRYIVQSLSVYPIKSCGAFKIPPNTRWQVTAKGLAWDREWCLVHEGTNVALSQKRCPRMALLQPSIDLTQRKLSISYKGEGKPRVIDVDLDESPTSIITSAQTCYEAVFKLQNSRVCGDTVPIHVYNSTSVNAFFSDVLGVPCCLARYSRETAHPRNVSIRKPSGDTAAPNTSKQQPQLMLSNESPILIVSTSSVNELNSQIKQTSLQTGKPAPPEVSASSFRANIIVAPAPRSPTEPPSDTPYVEDTWTSLSITPPPSPSESHPLPSWLFSTSTSSSSSASQNDSRSSSSSITNSIPGSFFSSHPDVGIEPDATAPFSPPPDNARGCGPKPGGLTLDILGPCQRCAMLGINQITAQAQTEPFCTLAKTRRKGDGRVWFGVHAALAGVDGGQDQGKGGGHGDDGGDGGVLYVQVGDCVVPSVG